MFIDPPKLDDFILAATVRGFAAILDRIIESKKPIPPSVSPMLQEAYETLGRLIDEQKHSN